MSAMECYFAEGNRSKDAQYMALGTANPPPEGKMEYETTTELQSSGLEDSMSVTSCGPRPDDVMSIDNDRNIEEITILTDRGSTTHDPMTLVEIEMDLALAEIEDTTMTDNIGNTPRDSCSVSTDVSRLKVEIELEFALQDMLACDENIGSHEVASPHGLEQEEETTNCDIVTVGNCEVHGCVIADSPDYVDVFKRNFPKLLRNYSFPMHGQICTCGVFHRQHKKRYQPPIHKTRDAPSGRIEIEEETPNGKMCMRTAHRKRRRNKRLRKRRMRPMSGTEGEPAEITDDAVDCYIQPLLQLLIAWKTESLWALTPLIVEVIKEQCTPEMLVAVNEWIGEKKEALQEFTIDDAVKLCQQLTSKWANFAKGDLFSLLSEIVNLLFVLILTPSEFIPKVMEKRQEFFKYLSSVKSRSGDVISWLIKTSSAIIASLKKFMETGSVVDAFCIATPEQEAAAIFDEAMLLYNNACLGLSEVDDLNDAFTGYIDSISRLSNAMGAVDSRRCSGFITKIKLWKNEISVREQGKKARVQPFAVVCAGSTGSGKTGLAYNLLPYILKINGFAHGDRNILNPNMASKHWDGVTNETYGMLWDDPDFMKPEYCMEQTYVEKIGRVLNNAQYLYEMANLENKGTTCCRVKAAVLGSNDREYGIKDMAKEPPAMHRRFQAHFDVSAKEEFCRVIKGRVSTVIDPAKVYEKFGNIPFPDIYKISAYDVLVVSRGGNNRKTTLDDSYETHQTDRYAFVLAKHKGVVLEDVDIKTILEFIRDRSKHWFAMQEKLVKLRSEQELLLCDQCQLPKELCACIEKSESSGSSGNESVDDGDNKTCSNLDDSGGNIDESITSPKDDDEESILTLPEEQQTTAVYNLGVIPKEGRPGPLGCSICRSRFAPESLWGYIDHNGTTTGICRSCLATTRLCCSNCQMLPATTVGMRRKPLRTVMTQAYCKHCTMKPTGGFVGDLSDKVTGILQHEASVRTITDNSQRNVRKLMKSYIDGGYTSLLDSIGNMDTAISQHSAKFLAAIFKSFLHYIELNGLSTWQTWLPDGIENSIVGHYLHANSKLATCVRRLDHLSLIASVLLVSSLTFWKPSVAKVVALALGYVHGKGNGRTVSTIVLEFLKQHPELLKKGVSVWRFATATWTRNKLKAVGVLLARVSPLIPLCWKVPSAVCPVAFALFVLGSYKCVNRKGDLETGVAISQLSNLLKTTYEGQTIKAWRNDVLPNLLHFGVTARMLAMVANTVNDVRLASGIKPMGGALSIQDFSSLSGMSKDWYKKEWYNANLDAIPVDKRCMPTEIVNALTSNMLHFYNPQKQMGCGAVALWSKIMLIPGHMLSEGYTKYVVTRKDNLSGLCGNARIITAFRKKDAKKVAPDLYAVEHSSLGDFADISKYFIQDTTRIPGSGVLVWRDAAGTIVCHSVSNMVKQRVHNNAYEKKVRQEWDGLSYHSDGVCDGYCMAIIISYENPSAALGFALGGNDVNQGVSTLTASKDIQSYCQMFKSSPSFVMTPCSGTLPQQMYNMNCVIQGVHPNSVAACLGEGEYKLFGSTGKVIRDSHDMVETPIAEKVYAEMCTTKRWSAPPLEGHYSERKRKEKWLHTLEKYTEPKEMIPRDLIDDAVDDYLHGLDEFMAKHPPTVSRCLTDKEVVEGIDGCDFIGPVDPNTSVGFPIEKKKRQFMESYDDGNARKNRFVTDQFRSQSIKSEKEYLDNRRTYPVSKAFVKIEATDVTKEKCRIVYGAPFHMQWTVRKKLGAVVKYICENPEFFECSVGVNPYGKDWARMYNRLRMHGRHRCVALDYKMYDATTSSQIVQAAMAVLIAVAEKMGWSEEDLTILRGLTADIMWPVVCANGDLLQLYNGTVSGHGLTSVLNSIGNSINMRVVFYTVYPKGLVRTWVLTIARVWFRDVIVAYFYGDDLIATVSKRVGRFHNHAIVAVLGTYGRVLTSYDKRPQVSYYDDLHCVEYLKRPFRYDRVLRTITGPLNESSIYKRLVCVHKPTSPNTMYTLLADSVESACAEWFYYGEQIFNARRRALREIIDEHNDPILVCACRPALRMSYKERLHAWKLMYDT